MTQRIAPFTENHLEQAADLVCARVRLMRQRVPLLPAAYESPQPILGWLGDLAAERPGVVALQDGELAGFMLALYLPRFFGRPTAYSPVWANALLPGSSPRLYTDMYAHLADLWVGEGTRTHLVTLLAGDPPALQAWQWLGFALINVDGVRQLAPLPGKPLPGIKVRQATPADAAVVDELTRALQAHLAASPTFFPHDLDEITPQFEGDGYAIWLAEAGGEAQGYLSLAPGADCECGLLQDLASVNISGAFIRPEWRGQGVASLLVNQALAWAQAQGAARCAVDFEATNVLAARFWMRWFTPVAYSLIRFVEGWEPS